MRSAVRRRPGALAALGALALAGCQMPLAFQEPLNAHPGAAGWQGQERFRSEAPASDASAARELAQETNQTTDASGARSAQESPLLPWTGVVQSPQQGSITTLDGPPTHGLEPSIEGRMHIIELYQEVLDERDQLLSEVQALQKALTSSKTQLDEARSSTMDRETRISALEAGNRTLLEENRDLAARLTTAQIRRLEAEKLLLETQIAWHRERAASGLTARPASQSKGE